MDAKRNRNKMWIVQTNPESVIGVKNIKATDLIANE